MDSQTTPRRYANGLITRELLLDAAATMFTGFGYRAVSLRDIAAHAQMTHAGLLRHFSSKEDILFALVERFDLANERWVAERGGGARAMTPADVLELARHNAGVPGFIELLASLAGEATSPRHPAHDYMRNRYRRARAFTVLARDRAVEADVRDSTSEASRFLALWDGLHLQHLYDSSAVDVVDGLASYLGESRQIRPPSRSPAADSPREEPSESVGAGYSKTQERRTRIIDTAISLFAVNGFHDTPLAVIADRAGVPKSSLMRYFPTKEHLLAAVLAARDDRGMHAVQEHNWRPGEHFAKVVESARVAVESMPGLVAFFAVLTSEALAAEHPAHDYMCRRYEHARRYFTRLFTEAQSEGMLADGRDPAREAVAFIATWDGLQIQWLYDAGEVNVPAALAAHLRTVLVPGALSARTT